MSLENNPVSLVVGGTYLYYRGGTYSLVGVGRHVHTHQQLVCYRGLSGRDEGQLLFCPLVDWAMKSTLVPEALPEKVVRNSSVGPEL